MAFAKDATPSTLAEAAGNKKTIKDGLTYTQRRFAEIRRRKKAHYQNVATQAAQNNPIVTSVADIDPLQAKQQHMQKIDLEGTPTADLATRSQNRHQGRLDQEGGVTTAYYHELLGATATTQSASTDVDYNTGSAGETLREITGTNDASKNLNSYPVRPTVSAARGEARTSWSKIQGALQRQISPNELYDDGASEYELSTYMLTWIMLPESEILGKRLNDIAAKITTVDSIKDVGGVIVAASAGTDEFYIEELEFTSYMGGPGIIANSFAISIRSPFQADFVDHIFKAAQFLKIRNHNDIAHFLLINWNGRETETSKPHKFLTSRCIPFRIRQMGLTYDEAGGMYEVDAIRYDEHNMATGIATTTEDLKIEGVKVVDMVENFLSRANTVFAKTIDNAIMPDVYAVEMSEEWAGLDLVTDEQAKKSNTSQNTNSDSDKNKSEKNQAGIREDIRENYLAGNTSAQTRDQSATQLEKDKFVKTAVYKAGVHITTIIKDILESTKEYQKMLTAHEVDPQASDAQQKRSDKKIVKRYEVGFDFETEILGYDGNRRKYACKRIFVCRKRLDPTLAKDDNVTQQTKELSSDRLQQILGLGLLKKAYPYYWEGLNTEIKSLDFKFDNHWIMAQSLYSKMGGAAKRILGIVADETIGRGQTSTQWNDARDTFEQEIIENQGAIKKLDKEIELVTQTMGGFEARRAKALIADKNAKQKKLEEEIKRLMFQRGVSKTQIAALKSGNFEHPSLESLYTADPDHVLFQTDHEYYVEKIEKFTGGVRYMGDMNKEDKEGQLFPIPMVASVLPKVSSGMREDFDRGYNILSEIVAKKEGGDMISVDLEIRGDPYWIPETFNKPNNRSVSPVHQQPYLIILASSTIDYNEAGIFQVNERSSINAIYFVIRVQNRFSGGEFSQVLECKRDLTVEINSVLRNPDKYFDMTLGMGGIT
jgi:hypothetical protein